MQLAKVIDQFRVVSLSILLLTALGCQEGVAGKDGVDGTDGTHGADGLDGTDGEKGADGDDGAKGADGEDGAMGAKGEDGTNGTNGTNGLNGTNGTNGINGVDGKDGKDGKDGSSGGGGAITPPTQEEFAVLDLSDQLLLDGLYGVTFDQRGNIVAVGQAQVGVVGGSPDYATLVARFLPNGQLDPSFGGDGVVIHNVTVGGTAADAAPSATNPNATNGELARCVVVQSNGRIVVVGKTEHDTSAGDDLARDRDVVVMRFNENGTLDTDFGPTDTGVVQLNLNDGILDASSVLTGADDVWGCALAADDKIVIHAIQRGEGLHATGPNAGMARTDTDWVLVRLTADGAPDSTFGGGDGKTAPLDIGEANASQRGVTVLEDGSIIGSGYTTSAVLVTVGTSQQPVLYKVDDTGAFDTTFALNDDWGEDGVFHSILRPSELNAEAYDAVLQGDKLVTIGYGPTALGGFGTDWISFRFTLDGDLDPTYGTNGVVELDAAGLGDNGRSLLVLPDNRIMGIGGGRPTQAVPPVDSTAAGLVPVSGMVAVLTENGAPDATFATGGFKFYQLGGTSDFFWGGAVSPDESFVAIVGTKSSGSTALTNDAALLLLPLKK